MINPSYMTRQVHENQLSNIGVKGNITSLKPIRPENVADKWEKIALLAFDKGEKTMSNMAMIGNAKYYRFMKPLMTEKSCLKCHEKQGYKIGDVRGGISISIPMDSPLKETYTSMLIHGLIEFIIWIFGFGGIVFGYNAIKKGEDKLIESNSMKELLLDIIAHDLKNPAGVIKGFAEFGLETDPNNEILKEIDGGVNNLLDIISGATTLSKVALGDTIIMEELDLVNIINIAIGEHSSQLEAAGMILDFETEEKFKMTANPIICEIFRNYISNAIKYAKAGKKIVVELIVEDDFVTVNVKDLGETIKQEDRVNVFTRNIQLGKTMGRGLGLAIVKGIADAHNAEVGVIPNKPNGNIFYFKLPLATTLK